MRVVEGIQQGTPQWLYERCGKITSSRLGDVMARLTRASKNGKAGDPTGDYHEYKSQLACERMTGIPFEHYVTPAMQHGIDMERFARETYAVESGNDVDRVGFVLHPTLDYAGASPDGLVLEDGSLEIKCPTQGVHYKSETRRTEVPKEHI